jgi:lysophospholipase L1-like esterase
MRLRRTLLTLGVLAILIGGLASSSPAQPGRSGDDAPRYYLALGTSLSVGVQPDANGENQPTDEGYPDQLHVRLQPSHPRLRLVKLGCPGETVASMITGGFCRYPLGSQLAEAVAFLHAHRQFVALVTIDLGANDIEPCGSLAGLDPACVNRAVAEVAAGLPWILQALRDASGPAVPIVGMNYYDPFLAAWLLGPAGQQLAQTAAAGSAMFNALLGGLYAGFAVPVADVAAAFQSDDFTTVPGVGLPLNVLLVCRWTWMCVPPPVGPNIHATAEGYAVIAEAFLAALP